MKITYGIIVLNGDFLLKQVLESIYDSAHAICIAEGSVSYWNKQGVINSTDDTIKIIKGFPDKENKIRLVQSTWNEKKEQCEAWFNLVPEDTDYVWCVDSDEVHTPENIEKVKQYLEDKKPTSLGFQSDSFYGGFDRIIGGFEKEHSFKRILQYRQNSTYLTHRQPTLALNGHPIKGNDILGIQLFKDTGVSMWHGSYISPKQVFEKIKYYESSVISKGNCIPNYFKDVYLEWILNPEKRESIEKKWNGVQEFMPHARGVCFTEPYKNSHPEIIMRDMSELIAKFDKQLQEYARL